MGLIQVGGEKRFFVVGLTDYMTPMTQEEALKAAHNSLRPLSVGARRFICEAIQVVTKPEPPFEVNNVPKR